MDKVVEFEVLEERVLYSSTPIDEQSLAPVIIKNLEVDAELDAGNESLEDVVPVVMTSHNGDDPNCSCASCSGTVVSVFGEGSSFDEAHGHLHDENGYHPDHDHDHIHDENGYHLDHEPECSCSVCSGESADGHDYTDSSDQIGNNLGGGRVIIANPNDSSSHGHSHGDDGDNHSLEIAYDDLTEEESRNVNRGLTNTPDIVPKIAGPSISGFEHTTGHKNVLWIRFDHSDRVRSDDPQNVQEIENIIANISNAFYEESFGKTSLSVDVYDNVLRLPQTSAFYRAQGNDDLLRQDIQQALSDAGINKNAFDRIIYETHGLSFNGGFAEVSGDETWFREGVPQVIAHELGHNYGFRHANTFETGRNSSLDVADGGSLEYGNVLDIMGSGESTFNSYYKSNAGWIEDGEEFLTVTQSGSHKLVALEANTEGSLSTLKIERANGEQPLWLSYRAEGTGNYSQGLYVYTATNSSNSATLLLDLTPESNNPNDFFSSDVTDGALLVGRTFAFESPQGVVRISVVGLSPASGDTPASVDVVVTVGEDLDNVDPTSALTASATDISRGSTALFSANASDSDGDVLVYEWLVNGRAVFNGNSGDFSYRFNDAGEYQVQVVVSDSNGGFSVESQTIRVGSVSSVQTFSGEIRTASGTGVEGVRVTAYNDTGAIVTYTDENGQYSFTSLRQGAEYELEATLISHSFMANFVGNAVAGNASYNFLATAPSTVRVTSSGGGTVSSSSFRLANGASKTLTVTPDQGYVIESVTVGGVAQALPTDLRTPFDFTVSTTQEELTVDVQFRAIGLGDNLLQNPSFDLTNFVGRKVFWS